MENETSVEPSIIQQIPQEQQKAESDPVSRGEKETSPEKKKRNFKSFKIFSKDNKINK